MIPGRWFTAKEGAKYVIRRRMGDKQPRYPRAKYAHCTTLAEVEAFCTRLNHEEGRKAKERVEIQTAFIPQAIMDAFRDMLAVAVPNEKDFNYLYETVLKSYFLKFFVTTLSLPDPKQWHKNQERWGAALLGKHEHTIFDMAPSAKTLKTTIQLANRFMKFLNQKMPEEYPLVELSPLSKAAIKEHEANRLLLKESTNSFISDDDWLTIEVSLPSNIGCYIQLMYYYGLRRSETLGFTSTDAVKRAHLNIDAQLASLSVGIKPLKGRKSRKTPHWFGNPQLAYDLIRDSLFDKMHPDTLSLHWETLMDKLGMSYHTHDLRRTFITRALRLYVPRDVQLAVGHEDLRTTMRYAQDDRDMDNETWKPGLGA